MAARPSGQSRPATVLGFATIESTCRAALSSSRAGGTRLRIPESPLRVLARASKMDYTPHLRIHEHNHRTIGDSTSCRDSASRPGVRHCLDAFGRRQRGLRLGPGPRLAVVAGNERSVLDSASGGLADQANSAALAGHTGAPGLRRACAGPPRRLARAAGLVSARSSRSPRHPALVGARSVGTGGVRVAARAVRLAANLADGFSDRILLSRAADAGSAPGADPGPAQGIHDDRDGGDAARHRHPRRAARACARLAVGQIGRGRCVQRRALRDGPDRHRALRRLPPWLLNPARRIPGVRDDGNRCRQQFDSRHSHGHHSGEDQFGTGAWLGA